MALPYIPTPVSSTWLLSPYPLTLLAGIFAGVAVMRELCGRFSLPDPVKTGFAPVLVATALVTAHVYDVIAYQLDSASSDSGLWFHLLTGVSVFGALTGVALVTLAWTWLKRLDLARHADVIAVAALVAMSIGRIGCALVHDHPGVVTDSPFGVDFPASYARMFGESSFGNTVRMHDVGLEELLLVIPLAIAGWVLVHRRLRAGMTAAILGVAYACVRFALDFLRLPMTEPTYAGFTAGQWSSAVLAVVAAICAARIARVGHIAPLADELGGQLGGRRRAALPAASVSP